MTATTGMRRRFASSRPSTAAAGQRASEPLVPIEQGGTGERTAPEAAAALGVPTLDGDNAFTGAQTFGGAAEFNAAVSFQAAVSVDADIDVTTGSINATGDPSVFSGLSVTGDVSIAGSLRVAYVAKTADYGVGTGDCTVGVTANSPTITLPTAVGVAGRLYILKNSGAGIVTLATTSSQTIDGAVPGVIAAGGVLRLFSDGANWQSW